MPPSITEDWERDCSGAEGNGSSRDDPLNIQIRVEYQQGKYMQARGPDQEEKSAFDVSLADLSRKEAIVSA